MPGCECRSEEGYRLKVLRTVEGTRGLARLREGAMERMSSTWLAGRASRHNVDLESERGGALEPELEKQAKARPQGPQM